MFSRLKTGLSFLKHGNTNEGTPIEYEIGQFLIQLPEEHLLPVYQKEHPLYDRFLPYLAKHLEKDDIVVDVGANCGDTMAGMINANPGIRFLCVEPDPIFYRFLETNVRRIFKILPDAAIELIPNFIASTHETVVLSGSKGTRTRSISTEKGSTHQTKSLREILTASKRNDHLRLIKTDVDGYDYDVITSADEWLNHDDLMIFFECMYDEEFQRKGFIKLIKTLPSKGFSDFWLFDNFGNFMLHITDSQHIEQLIDYVWRQNLGLATRSLYYFDILATKPNDHELVTDLINNYALSE